MSLSQKQKNNYYAQVFSALLAVILCIAAVLVYWRAFAADKEDTAYPLEGYVANYNPYIQQFDALKKGQTNIDWEADPALEELENVYDYSERTASKIYYLWDRAYYDGKYYSYFGLAPVLTVYFPYYWINGTLPGTGYVMTIFCLIAAIFMPLCLFQWAWNFAPKTPHWLLLTGSCALFWGSLILLLARGYTPFYYIACVAGLAFLSAFFWLCLRAYSEKELWLRCVLYALAGIAFGLTFQSRINIAFAAAFAVLPGLWFFIIRRRRNEKGLSSLWRILAELASLGLPVLLFFAGSMIFNAMRFSGPLDFGTDYQLTVCDTSTYKVRLRDIPFAYFHYLLDMPADTDVYPYITLSYIKFSNYGHYVYKDASLGMFAVPLAVGVICSPAIIFSKNFTPRARVFSACALMCVLTVPVLDFGLGGVIYRYTGDFTFIGVFLAGTSLISLCGRIGEKKGKKYTALMYIAYAFCAVFFVFSVIACIRLVLINDNGNVNRYGEELSEAVEKLLPFKAAAAD